MILRIIGHLFPAYGGTLEQRISERKTWRAVPMALVLALPAMAVALLHPRRAAAALAAARRDKAEAARQKALRRHEDDMYPLW